MRIALMAALLALTACGGKKSSTTPDERAAGGGEDVPVVTAQMLIGWGTQGYNPEAQVPKTKVFLEVTDHHGATQSYPLEDIEAPCSPKAGNGGDIITALACAKEDGTGAEFRAVYRGNDVIVLRRWVRVDDDPAEAELDFQEISRIAVPTGSKVKPTS
jgi:hypothetical protein